MKIKPIKKQNQNKLTMLMVCIAVTTIVVLLGTSFFRPDLAFAQET